MIAIDRTALPMTIEGDGIEFRTDAFGSQTIAWVRLPRGADLRPGLVGLPGDLCQCPHWGYMLAGRLRMHTAEGPQTYEAGQAFYWAPGHAPEASRTASTSTSPRPIGSTRSTSTCRPAVPEPGTGRRTSEAVRPQWGCTAFAPAAALSG